MEERYLFKAKRIDNEEWVQGYLVYDNRDKLCRIITEINYSTGTCLTTDNAPRVDISTICQCTGLKDRNGRLIWENDIMVAHLDDDYPEDETYIRILWRGSGFYSKEKGSEDMLQINEFDQEYFEVIGNIFDNKDIFESEE